MPPAPVPFPSSRPLPAFRSWRAPGAGRRRSARRPAARDAVEFAGGEPAQLQVLQGLRLVTVQETGHIYPEDGTAVGHPHVAAEPGADLHPDAQLLGALADQRVGLGLPRLDLAAGELPAPGHL